MNFPENLRYTKDHEWIRVEGNEAIIGITDFAQHELGDIVYVEVEPCRHPGVFVSGFAGNLLTLFYQ